MLILLGKILAASGQTGPTSGNPFYIVREEDGTSVLTLEEGGGAILTEETV